MKTRRAILYLRVSSYEQTLNLSLSHQQDTCHAYCEKNGYEVAETFRDEGESAKTTDRTALQALLKYVGQHHKKVDAVIVYNLSRLTRSLPDHFELKKLFSALTITVISVTEPTSNTAFGRFVENFIQTTNQFDNERKGEHSTQRMQELSRSGRWMFRPPLGYLQVGNGPKAEIRPDPTRAPLVRQAFELFSTGLYSRKEVLERVTAAGLRTRRGEPVSAQTFHTILRNPFYKGVVFSPKWGTAFAGLHEALVDESTFERVQALLRGDRPQVKPKSRNNPEFFFTSFIRCAGCRRPLAGSGSTGNGGRYRYYKCPRACKLNVPASKLETMFFELVRELAPDAAYLSVVRHMVGQVWSERTAEMRSAGRDVARRIEDLKARKQRLLEAFVYDRAIDKDSFDSENSQLAEKIALAELERHEYDLEELDVDRLFKLTGALMVNPAGAWASATSEQKRRLQAVFFPTGLTFDGSRFGTEATNILFKNLAPDSGPEIKLASLTGFEPVSPP